MSKVTVTESHLEDIADAIRAKNGSQATYKPGDMAAAISAIPTGGITPTGTISITQNGTVDVTQYANAEVNVSGGGGTSEIINMYGLAFVGTGAGASVSSLSYTITGWNGYYAIITVMHRASITVPGWTLVDSRLTHSAQAQYISVYKKHMDSDSVVLEITQASAQRMSATVWMSDDDVTITYITAKNYAIIGGHYCATYTAKAPTLAVHSSYSQPTSGTVIPYVNPSTSSLTANSEVSPVRHFSCLIQYNKNNTRETIIGQTSGNSSNSNALVALYEISK